MRNQGFQKTESVTIANGQATSAPINIRGMAQCGILLPAAFTGATIGFSVSADGETYATLYDSSNTAVAITVTQGRAYALPINVFPFAFVKLVSASSEGAARTIIVSGKY